MKRRILVGVLAIVLLFNLVCMGAMATEVEYPVLMPDTITNISIQTPGEVVRYKFVAEFSCKYSFYSDGDEDTYGELYDMAGNLIYSNDDYYGLNFGIECGLEVGETYILEVCLLDTAIVGSFDLITSTDHDQVSELIRAPECTEDGLWSHKCLVCNYEWTETIPAEHDYQDGVCLDCGAAMLLNGSCGDALEWCYDGATGELIITGSGPMYDYNEDAPPWSELYELVSSVVIGEGATSIGHSAFSEMDAISSVSLPSSILAIGDSAFSYCSSLSNITFPEGISEIGMHAFSHCHSLTEVTIPASVSSIGFGAFQGGHRLAKFLVNEANPYYWSDNYGVLYDKLVQRLIQAPVAITGAYIIPDTVSIIADSAFEGCSQLSALTIPKGITEIGSYAFVGCINLTFLRIPASVTLIGDSAFTDCNKLQAVLFEGDAPTIEDVIFDNLSTTAYHLANNETWTEAIRNACGVVTWKSLSGLSILAQPETREELIGNSITYVVGAYGDDLQYTWWASKPGSDVFEKTSASDSIYTVTVTSENVGQKLYCEIVDKNGAKVRTEIVTICAMAVLEENNTVQVDIAENNAFKYFSFTPKYSCYYTFCSYGDFDTYFELYDDQYNLLISVDDGNDQNFYLNTSLEAGHNYIVGVYIYDEGVGSFTFGVQCEHDIVSTDFSPTCTTNGYTNYECINCEYCYQIPLGDALGHSWVNATCTTAKSCSACGMTEGKPLGHDYKTIVTNPSCVLDGSIIYTCAACGNSYTETIDATGHTPMNGICVDCGEVVCTITQKGRNLSYEDMIYVIDIFELLKVDGIDLTKDAGLLIWSVEEFEALSEIAFDADHANPGLKPYRDTAFYYGSSEGIFTRDLYKEAYYVGYVKLSDGSFVYSEPKLYSPAIYAYSMLGKESTSQATKDLCIALLNYISAAQMYFDRSTPAENLVNADLSDAQKALNWEIISFNQAAQVPANMQVTKDEAVFSKIGKNLLFEEMISIVSIYMIDDDIISDAKEYGTIYWTAEQFAALDGLPGVNNIGDGTKTGMSVYRGNAGQWYSQAPAVAAKDMAGTQYYYLGYVVHADGSVSYSGVQSYTVEQYISNTVGKASTSDEMRAFAQWLYVYERAAKNALGNG